VVHSRLEDLADRIKGAGITHITGSVTGDDTHFDTQRYLPQWPRRFVSLAEIGPMSALLVNDGLVAFPPSPDVRVPKESPADDAATHAADQLTQLLVARGVTVDGAPGSGPAPTDAKEVAHLDSQPVGAITAAMLTESDNGSAELLTKELGVRDSGVGSTAAGVAAVTKALRGEDLPLDDTVQFDGSGLADDDRATCAAVQALLDRQGPASAFATSLPVAGQTGTLAERFLDTPLAGRLHAKTGTLNRSTALAGYLDTLQGARASFAFLMNVPAPQVISADDVGLEEELAGILLKYPETVDIAKLEPAP
jgi:D-alanyl-D-alanine carboxypeptidase/D-alanyl-D-alanine-endopeptidase (penicillin-binding protein 4)